ncbi:putative membrane protein YfcA [Lachnospiraceae bacterium KM106-2]|nr:putative membrane protein YfcA [Lachnospiraceae bacterium KM106-2]
MISLPAYLVAGFPPHLATATNKCSAFLGTLVSTLRFMKGQKIHYLTALVSAGAALIGSPIGANLNLILDEKYLEGVLIATLPIICIIMIMKKDFGSESKVETLSKQKIIIYAMLIGFFIGMYDGFLGPGTGTFLILAYCICMHHDIVCASGNAKVVNLASNVAAFVTFAFHGVIVWKIGIPAAIFGIAGNYVGSGLAVKNGKAIIRPIFIGVVALLIIKLGYDLFV